MIDPKAEAKRYISIDEVIQALIDDDPDTRFFENDGPRTEFEGQTLAKHTMMNCGFCELRPIFLWHPMADSASVVSDTSDELVTASISVALDGGPHGYFLDEVFDFLRDRVVRWHRTDVARLLKMRGVRVPAAVMPTPAPPPAVADPEPASAPKGKVRPRPLDGVIAIAVSRAAAGDGMTVWAEMCAMAEADDRPEPLLGYSPGDGIKYRAETPEGYVFYKKESFLKRWKRTYADIRGR